MKFIAYIKKKLYSLKECVVFMVGVVGGAYFKRRKCRAMVTMWEVADESAYTMLYVM